MIPFDLSKAVSLPVTVGGTQYGLCRAEGAWWAVRDSTVERVGVRGDAALAVVLEWLAERDASARAAAAAPGWRVQARSLTGSPAVVLYDETFDTIRLSEDWDGRTIVIGHRDGEAVILALADCSLMGGLVEVRWARDTEGASWNALYGSSVTRTAEPERKGDRR